MQGNDERMQPPPPNIRPYPGITPVNSYDDQIVAENTKPKRDWIPHLTILLVVAAFFTIIWISLTSRFDNIYIDIRELRTDVKKMDSRLDAIEKDIAIIKTKLNPVQPTSSQ